MTSSRFTAYKHIYFELLPVFVPTTALLGFITGLSQPGQPYFPKPLDLFTSIVGHTSIGIITGIIYPISYPLIGMYVIYKHHITPPQLKQ
jgi:hypothetical protein